MTLAEQTTPPLSRLHRAIAEWYDSPAERAVLLVLVVFVISWTAFQIISYASIDLHPDLTEVFAWSRHPRAGYFKHPPLAGLVAAAWFGVFPAADWSFHLLAMVNAAVALYGVDLIARQYVHGDKRLLVILLLLLLPFYQFHAQRFSTNQTLLSTWPFATYFFLKSFETRTLGWSAAAGAFAALAMLGKYYSVYLLAGFLAAALFHPDRWAYFRSPAPYVSAIAGLLVLSPHLYWLLTNGAPSFMYAALHETASIGEAVRQALGYALGGLAYASILLLAYLFLARPDRKAIAAALWPEDADRRMLVILLVVPLLLPMLTAPLFNLSLTSLWTMPAWFLLPIVLLAPPETVVTRRRAVQLALTVLVITACVLLAAPGLALQRHLQGDRDNRAYYRMIASEITQAWRQMTGRPLTIVSGDLVLPHAIAFYSEDHPDSVAMYEWRAWPWVTPVRLEREGWAIVCAADERDCIRMADDFAARSAGVVRREYDVTRYFFGVPAPGGQFVFVLIPPKPRP